MEKDLLLYLPLVLVGWGWGHTFSKINVLYIFTAANELMQRNNLQLPDYFKSQFDFFKHFWRSIGQESVP